MTSASVVSSTSGEKSVAYTINHVCIVQLSFNDIYFILPNQFHHVPIATLVERYTSDLETQVQFPAGSDFL